MDASSFNPERTGQGQRLRADRPGLTLIFGTLGVVNFAHGALFMLGAFCAVTLNASCRSPRRVIDETRTDFLGNPLKVDVPYVQDWFGPEIAGCDHRLVGAAVDPVRDPGHGLIGVVDGTRADQALLQAPPCRPDPGHLRPGHRAAGDHQVLLRRQPDPDPAPEAFRQLRFRRAASASIRTRSSIPTGGCLFLLRAWCHRRGVRLPAVHHLRHGGARRHGGP
jgi:hypothetical protein